MRAPADVSSSVTVGGYVCAELCGMSSVEYEVYLWKSD